jgi:hypothetical protein
LRGVGDRRPFQNIIITTLNHEHFPHGTSTFNRNTVKFKKKTRGEGEGKGEGVGGRIKKKGMEEGEGVRGRVKNKMGEGEGE